MDIKKFVLSYYSNATEDFHIKKIDKPQEALSLHSHDYYQIYYLKSGRLIHHLENVSAELKAGDVFIIPPNLPHYIETASKDVCFYSISFTQRYMTEIVKSNKLAADFIHCITNLSSEGSAEPSLMLRTEDASLTDVLVQKILQEFLSDITGKDQVIKSSLSLLISVFARAYLEDKCENVKFVSEREAIVHCIGYIKNHLSEAVTLQEIAKRTAMSKSSFCENFRKITGETFNQYINRERVEAAAEQIRLGKPVFKAAMDLGYGDFSTFYRNFKKRFGVPPSEYK
jgi:AraC-like DNA-binding protein